MAAKTTRGAQIIAAERQRQVDREGWDASHDDAHQSGELAAAAICYAKAGIAAAKGETMFQTFGMWEDGACTDDWQYHTPPEWPNDWLWDYWKPVEDPIKNLRRAGALIAAEIDRLLREKRRNKRRPLVTRVSNTSPEQP